MEIENEIEKILRQVWVDGWDRGKKQARTPYKYTLSDDSFLKKKWEKLLKIICRQIVKTSDKTIKEATK